MNGDISFKRRKLNANSYRPSSASPDPDSLGPSLARARLNAANKSSGSATPRSYGRSTPRQHEFDGPEPNVDEEDQLALDRDWYGGEENGHAFGDETHNPFGGIEDSWA
jgi:pre-mRNA-splicing factor ATP-dependent RNA helicase DHX38/PRP16